MWARLNRINYWFDETSWYLKVAILMKYASENNKIRVCEKYLFVLN